MRTRTPLQRLGLLAALFGCIACPGTLDDPALFVTNDAGDATSDSGACPDVPSGVFLPTCATATCHSATVKQQGLDLESPNVASRLVGVCATEGPGTLLDPSNPSQSVVYTKITANPPFGARMPFGLPPLDDPTLACVLAWVSAQTGPTASCAGDAATADSGAVDTSAPSDDAGEGAPDAGPG